MSGEASSTVRLVWAVIVVATVWLGRTGLAEPPAKLPDRPCDLRVESELFSAGDDEPVARSLTLFHHGVAWDFLELVDADTKTAAIAEIVLHDPAGAGGGDRSGAACEDTGRHDPSRTAERVAGEVGAVERRSPRPLGRRARFHCRVHRGG